MDKSCVSLSRKLEINTGYSFVQSNITEKTIKVWPFWSHNEAKPIVKAHLLPDMQLQWSYYLTMYDLSPVIWNSVPNFMHGLLNNVKAPPLSEGESVTILVSERRQNYWWTKYAKLWHKSSLIFPRFKLCIVYHTQFLIHTFRLWLRAR